MDNGYDTTHQSAQTLQCILEILLHLRSSGFTWKKINSLLLVSRWTLRRHIVSIEKYVLEEITGFSMISDEQLDNLVELFVRKVSQFPCHHIAW